MPLHGFVSDEEYLPEPREPYPEPQFRVERNEKYRGNPLIEALPEVPSKVEAFNALAHRPKTRPKDFRTFSPEAKLDLLSELQQLFVPTNLHIRALQLVVAVIRECYEPRNINRPEVQQRLYRAERGEQIGITRLSPTGGGSNGMVLWGVTGSGKTSWVDRLQEFLYSQFLAGRDIARGPIYHRLVQGRKTRWPQLPMVRMQCQTTLKGTIAELFSQLDGELGTSLSKRLGGRWVRSQFVTEVRNVLTIHFVGILVVEDVHNLKDQAEDVLNYFCDLMEESGFPTLLVGTYKLRGPLEADPSVFSKLAAKAKIDFEPLSLFRRVEGMPDDEIDDDDDWTPFVQEMWNLNVFTTPTKMPRDLPEWLHFHTEGVRRFAREMMTIVFRRSAYDDELVVDLDLLDDIAANEMAHYQESVHALRMRAMGTLDAATAKRFENLMLPLDAETARENGLVLRKEQSAKSKSRKGKSPRNEEPADGGPSDTTSASPAESSTDPKTSATKPPPRKRRRASRQPLTAQQVYDGLLQGGRAKR